MLDPPRAMIERSLNRQTSIRRLHAISERNRILNCVSLPRVLQMNSPSTRTMESRCFFVPGLHTSDSSSHPATTLLDAARAAFQAPCGLGKRVSRAVLSRKIQFPGLKGANGYFTV